ncbi:MAG: hypothetical protein P1U41_06600 [Vicingaceae bacterium]|nr:hypothetical protein [Vicingaceae bacterium]
MVLIFLISCGEDTRITNDSVQNDSLAVNIKTVIGEAKVIEPVRDEEVVVLEKDGIKLTEIKAESSKAELALNTNQFKEGKNHLTFSVNGMSDYNISYLANNYFLSQFSSDVFEMEFLYGNNVFLAFLTDKNNMAIKSNKGSVLKNAVVGEIENMFDMNQPHLFYYLPKSIGVEPILDFYLVNTTLNENGNKVKVTINQTEFIIKKWAAYQISGLPKPDNTIRIQLIDKDGNLIDGPFNDSGERSFSLINTAS